MNKFFFILVVAAVVATNMISLPVMAEDTQVVDPVARGLISALDERVVKLNATVAQYNGIYTIAANKAVKAAADEMNFIKKVKSDLESLKKDAVTTANLEKTLQEKNYLSAAEIKLIMENGEPKTEAGKALKPCITALANRAIRKLAEDATKKEPLGETADPKEDDATSFQRSINTMTDKRTEAVRKEVADLKTQVVPAIDARVTTVQNQTNSNWEVIWRNLWIIGGFLFVILAVLTYFVWRRTKK